MNLSKNFTLDEMIQSDTATAQGWEDDQLDINDTSILNLQRLAETVLQPSRNALGGSIRSNSGYRSRKLNDYLGSTEKSDHRYGRACDQEVVDGLSPSFKLFKDTELAAWAELCGAPLRKLRCNANFILFLHQARNIEAYGIKQLIHEYGNGWTYPGWVHVSICEENEEPRNEICIFTRQAKQRKLSLYDIIDRLQKSYT
jgi:hypothetical protein